MDCLRVRFHISPAFRRELTQIIGVTSAGPVPNADKVRSAGDLCWDLHTGQRKGVITAVSLRCFILSGHGIFLGSAEAPGLVAEPALQGLEITKGSPCAPKGSEAQEKGP